MEVSVTTSIRWMIAVSKQQIVHHLTGTGSMQYILNMMNLGRKYFTLAASIISLDYSRGSECRTWIWFLTLGRVFGRYLIQMLKLLILDQFNVDHLKMEILEFGFFMFGCPVFSSRLVQ